MTSCKDKPPHEGPWLRLGLAGLAWGTSLAIYASTSAPWLTWAHDGADGGDLITACMTWGVPHPSGYPTYCLLARLFATLPLGNPAHRFALFSATMAAAAVSLAYLLIANFLSPMMRGKHIIAWGCALAWGLGHTLWSQAVIAEVYALHAFFTALILYIASCHAALERPRTWFGLGLAIGVGLGNHLTLALIIPGLIWWLWPKAHARRVLLGIAGTILGLAVYLYIPWAAYQRPLVNWGGASTWQGFWWLVSGQLYRPYVFGVPWQEIPWRVLAWGRLWIQEFTLLGMALVVGGLLERPLHRWGGTSLLVVALVSLWAIGYHTRDAYVYLLPAFLIGATWLAQGTLVFYQRIGQRFERLGSWVTILPLILALGLLVLNGGRVNVRHDDQAIQWAQAVIQEAPQKAWLISGDDRHTFTLDYLLWVEGWRRDLIVIDADLLPFTWYRDQLVRRYPSLSPLQATSLPSLLAQLPDHQPLCLTTLRPEVEQAFALAPRGVLWCSTPH